ncbi:hypothetical protein OSB04_002498 [Centaurea solstitialis]|uniref:Retrovirus-related Pol polyprotein from transposon TNT 1-94-like beta-barrel domain-containing protein n=1 Tax=Centaurea solstitialis TaxID=347529 RepID=A0AA38UAS6_9ASTR|nr:hypothetical protein OSB04_002498 [Centaurea solstitialis]
MTPQKPTPQRLTQKPRQDSAYFKRKADFYNKKVLLAQTSELVTDESSEEDEPQKGLVAFEDSEDETELCGMARSDSDSVNSKNSVVSSELKELYFEIVENIDSQQEEFNCLEEKLSMCEKEMNILTEERTRFFNMYEQAEANRIELYKSLKAKTITLEKTLKEKDDGIKGLKNERTNALSVKEFFQTEREFLHRDLFDRELKIRKFQDAQNKSLQTTFKSTQNTRSYVPDSKSIFKRRKVLNKPESKTPLIFTNVALEDYIDSFSPSEKSESIPSKFETQSQLGIFEFGNSSTQENYDFQCIVKPLEKQLSSCAPAFIPRELKEASEKSVCLNDIECLCEDQLIKDSSNVETNSLTDLVLDSEMVTCSEYTSSSYTTHPLVVELTEPKLSRAEKEKWIDTNQTSVSAHAGNSEKEPRFVRESCTKIPKTRKGSNSLNSVPIFENFNEKFKSLSYNSEFCECVNLMHVLSNHFHNSSCLVLNHRGPSSRDFKGHFGNSKQKHVSTWYIDSGCSRHMTGTLELLSHYVNKEGSSVAFGGNQKGKIKGYGMIVKGEITVNQVSYVDGLKHNLISVSQLCDNGMDVMFKIKFCIVYKADTLIEVLTANRRGDLYLLSSDTTCWSIIAHTLHVLAYTDSNYGGCQVDRKSTSGSCHFLGGKLVSWSSKKQNCVSTSTEEAEYVVAASCCSQALWMQTQLRDYGYTFNKIPILYDNKSAIAISENPVQHSKTKHIDIRYNFLKHQVEEGNVEMYFVNTEFQLAELFTKALDEKQFTFLIEKIGMTVPLP